MAQQRTEAYFQIKRFQNIRGEGSNTSKDTHETPDIPERIRDSIGLCAWEQEMKKNEMHTGWQSTNEDASERTIGEATTWDVGKATIHKRGKETLKQQKSHDGEGNTDPDDNNDAATSDEELHSVDAEALPDDFEKHAKELPDRPVQNSANLNRKFHVKLRNSNLSLALPFSLQLDTRRFEEVGLKLVAEGGETARHARSPFVNVVIIGPRRT